MIPLSLLDIKDISISNPLIHYYGKRDFNSIKKDPLVEIISSQDQIKVVNSMSSPPIDILRLYDFVINDDYIEYFVRYVIDLYRKIERETHPKDILLINVLRSGFFLTVLLRYIIYKYYQIKVPIIGITPNYIEHTNIEKFKKFINFYNKKEIYFIDGWISTGVTYNIIRNFWQSFFPSQKFNYAVISNTATLCDKKIIYSTDQDILIPWSMAFVDNIGLSNYFLHPSKNIATSFYIPKDSRKLENIEAHYRKIVDKVLLDEPPRKEFFEQNYYTNHISFNLRRLKKQLNISEESDIKFGINEIIKDFEKGSTLKVFINPHIGALYLKIFKEYSKVYKIKLNFVEKLYVNNCYCVASRK
jgi:hypothetical protein